MINGIVAVDLSQGIGLNGSMPWPHLKGDMAWFRQQTTNNVVIMGSTTFNSISKALPNRTNIVLSKTKDYTAPGKADHTFSDPSTALSFAQIEYPDKEIFIIGGSEIYNLYFSVIDRFFITQIEENYNCDKFFNLTYVQNIFKNVKEIIKYTEPINYTIKEYSL